MLELVDGMESTDEFRDNLECWGILKTGLEEGDPNESLSPQQYFRGE